MADSDFERVCVAYWEDSPLAGIEWQFASDATQARVRRGMAAALREMLRQSSGRGAGQLRERAAVRACLEALLAQAEDREAVE